MQSVYSSINIFDSLKSKYNEYLKPGIISAAIVQFDNAVCLEYTEVEVVVGGLEKQTVHRISLDFVNENGEDELNFDSKDSIEINAIKFIDEFSPYSIAVNTGLFHTEACSKISEDRQAVKAEV